MKKKKIKLLIKEKEGEREKENNRFDVSKEEESGCGANKVH